MSLVHTVNIKCTNCNKEFDAEVWDSINTDLCPDVVQRIVLREFFKEKCPHCGTTVNIEYPTLYHDMKNKVLIQVMVEEFSKEQYEVLKNTIALFPGYASRIVRNIRELVEKVEIVEACLDDRVIEVYKYIQIFELMYLQPNFIVKDAYFLLYHGKNCLCYCGENSEQKIVEFDYDKYLRIEKRLYKLLKKCPTQHYAIIDEKWGRKMAVMIGEQIEAKKNSILYKILQFFGYDPDE